MNWYGRCGRDSIWAGIINAVISGVQNGNVDRTAGSFSGVKMTTRENAYAGPLSSTHWWALQDSNL